MVQCKETKNGKCPVKSLYSVLETRNATPFHGASLEPLWRFYGFRSFIGKVVTSDQLKRRRETLANRSSICLIQKESIDYTPINCTKARDSWELIFALFSMMWVLPLSVRDPPRLTWFLCGKEASKIWEAAPLCLFWTGLKGKK